MIAARDALGLKTQVVGVVSKEAAAAKLSFEAGAICETASANTFADGLAVRKHVTLRVSDANGTRDIEVIARIDGPVELDYYRQGGIMPGDCCVFCSYGSVPCPPIQQNGKCC